jgi:hypothetical protein
MKGFVVCLLVSAAVAACGGDGGGGAGTFSCSAGESRVDGGAASTIICVEGSGGSEQDLENNRAACNAPGAMFAEAPCTHAGAIGACRITRGSVSITTWYYGDTSSSMDVQQICTGLGETFIMP